MSDQPEEGFSRADSAPVHIGPFVNVDGTPMANDVVDVLGRVYGDVATPISCDSDPFDRGTCCTDS